MRVLRRAVPALGLACAMTTLAGAAAIDDAKLDAADACARIAADSERLACYDGLFGGERGAPAADFGLSEAQRQAANPETAQPAEPDEIASRVTRVIPRGLEPPVLELENGQQWRLLESMANVRFRAGDPIIIRRGAMGSYLVSNPERSGAWRVRRLR